MVSADKHCEHWSSFHTRVVLMKPTLSEVSVNIEGSDCQVHTDAERTMSRYFGGQARHDKSVVLRTA